MQQPTAFELPVPEDVLSLVIAKAREDHQETCDLKPELVASPEFTYVGHGRHIHDSACASSQFPGCLRHCANSDYVVTVCYNTDGNYAMYGVLSTGPGTWDLALWAD